MDDKDINFMETYWFWDSNKRICSGCAQSIKRGLVVITNEHNNLIIKKSKYIYKTKDDCQIGLRDYIISDLLNEIN